MAPAIGIKEMYLLAYNATCAEYGVAGALARVYASPDLDWLLTCAQCAAILEIVHSAVGVVRSPVMVTFMQVSSRIVALFALVNSPESQGM